MLKKNENGLGEFVTRFYTVHTVCSRFLLSSIRFEYPYTVLTQFTLWQPHPWIDGMRSCINMTVLRRFIIWVCDIWQRTSIWDMTVFNIFAQHHE